MKAPLRVHVIPVGDDPVGRIVNPAVAGRADKVIFLRFKGKDLFQQVHDAAREEIIKRLPLAETSIKEEVCDFYSVTDIVTVHARIIREEARLGNHVSINVSTGGKLNSIAGMLAAMLFGAEPYFCKMDFERSEVPEVPEILGFPAYVIQRPAPELVTFLYHVREYMLKRNRDKVSKGECIDIAKKLDPDFCTSGKSSGTYNKLKFKLLDKLARDHLVAVEPSSRGRVSITPEGQFAVDVFSAYYDLP